MYNVIRSPLMFIVLPREREREREKRRE